MTKEIASPLSFDASFLESSRVRLYTESTLHSIFSGLKRVNAGPVLDIGSGTGYFLDAYQRIRGGGNLLIRLDSNDALLAGPPGERLCASGDSIPLRSESVACVLMHFVLSRLPRAVARATLKEASRVLRRGGQLLAVEPCLGMTTYHSSRDDNVGRLAAIARRMKAQFQLDENDIDENYGLILPEEVSNSLTVTSTDLHIAKWYTGFPDQSDELWLSALRKRRNDLDLRNPVGDFVDAHGQSDRAFAAVASSLSTENGRLLDLTHSGFEELQTARLRDLDAAIEPDIVTAVQFVEFIPVVSVVARKQGFPK